MLLVLLLFFIQGGYLSPVPEWVPLGSTHSHTDEGSYSFPGAFPGGRYSCGLASYGNLLYLYSGSSRTDLWRFYTSDATWEFMYLLPSSPYLEEADLLNWTLSMDMPPKLSDPPYPGPRSYMTFLSYEDLELLFMYGGNRGGRYKDAWFYEFETQKWRVVGPTDPMALDDTSTGGDSYPGCRCQQQSWPVGSLVYIYGGVSVGGSMLRDLWTFSLVGETWTLLDASCAPGIRAFASTWVFDNLLYMYSGMTHANGDTLADSLDAYNVTSSTWIILASGSAVSYQNPLAWPGQRFEMGLAAVAFIDSNGLAQVGVFAHAGKTSKDNGKRGDLFFGNFSTGTSSLGGDWSFIPVGTLSQSVGFLEQRDSSPRYPAARGVASLVQIENTLYTFWGSIWQFSPVCFGRSAVDENACGGHGTCVMNDLCVCHLGWPQCWTFDGTTQENNWSWIAAAVVVPLLLIFVVIVLVAVIIIVLWKKGVFGRLRSLRKKKRQSVGVDAVLEREAEEQFAHLRLQPDLFKIEFDSLDIKKSIGSGGSNATVFLADWNRTTVAFKCFRILDFVHGEENHFEQFEKEVEVLGSVAHPNILRFYGATLKPPRVGIVMEYCPNGDIHAFLSSAERDSLDLGNRMRIMKEIAAAMRYLHERNIIHRDLKPENVLLDERLSAKLMDFGLSKIVSDLSHSKTAAIGTSCYMAPEMTRGEKYDEKVDQFAFGIMLFQLALGDCACPYDVENVSSVEFKVALDPTFRPNVATLTMPEQWSKIVDLMISCWDHHALDRPDFADIDRILTECIEAKAQ